MRENEQPTNSFRALLAALLSNLNSIGKCETGQQFSSFARCFAFQFDFKVDFKSNSNICQPT